MNHGGIATAPTQPITLPGHDPRSPKAVLRLVTPDLATAWLSPAINPNNRRLRGRHVEYFAHIMTTGQFAFTGEPVQFSGFLEDDTARLLNGQHRLAAIAKTGLTHRLLVIEGVDPGVMLYLDTGARRSFADNLHIAGHLNVSTLASVTQLYYLLSNPGTRSIAVSGGSNIPVTHQELMAWFDGHAEAIKQSMRHGRRLKEVFRASPAAASTAWLLINDHTEETPEDVDDFFDRLATEGPTGLQTSAGNGPALDRLRRWFTNQVLERSRERIRAPIQVAILIKGWNAEVRGDLVSHFRWRTAGRGAEDFPTPV